jgi:gluconate 5-dehydrogenase
MALLTGTRVLVTGATSGVGWARAVVPRMLAREALAQVMAADLRDTPVRANILLPGGATLTGMIPDDVPAQARAQLLDPASMGPPIVWLASPQAADVHDERILATKFQDWLAAR